MLGCCEALPAVTTRSNVNNDCARWLFSDRSKLWSVGRRQGLRFCVCAFQQAEKIAVGGEDECRFFREHFPTGLHALEKIIKFGGLRILRVSERINLGRFPVGFTTDLLDLPVGCGLN